MLSNKASFGGSFVQDYGFSSKQMSQNMVKRYNCLVLNVLITQVFMLGALGLTANPFSSSDYFDWIRIVSCLCIVAIGLLFGVIGWIKPEATKALLIIASLFIFFWTMESRRLRSHAIDETIDFILVQNIEFAGISLILGRISWKISSAFQILINTFCAFRYTDLRNSPLMYYQPVYFILKSLLLCLLAFFIEKFDIENIKKLKDYESSISSFKDLITKYFSHAVLIVKDQKLLFYNEKTLKILECEDNNKQIWTKLENLEIDDLYTSHEKKTKTDFFVFDDCKPILSKSGSIIKNSQILNHQSSHPRTVCCLLNMLDKRKSLEINLTKITWEGEPALMINISENQHLEKIKLINEQSEYKDKLLATVSHELRTPLNGIMGMIRTTIEACENLQSRKYLNIALRSSQLLLLMINDILDYSQISNGKLRLSFETFSLWKMIKEVSKLFNIQAKMKGLSFYKMNCLELQDSKDNTLIRSDQSRIKQVLFNLLGNALKFTVRGSIKISLTPWSKSAHCFSSHETRSNIPKAFKISVEDTGIGIKKEDQGNLFKLFGKLQNENTATLNGTGVGFGLAISQNLVILLNDGREDGKIEVVSEYKKGSCFSFVIYSKEENELAEELDQRYLNEKSDQEVEIMLKNIEREINSGSKRDSIKKINQGIIRKKRVLIVDDDQINVFVLRTYLNSLGNYEFDAVYDGEEAINKIRSKAMENYFFDVILMDSNMPKINGSGATLILDQMIADHEVPSVNIIVCTANTVSNNFCFQNGALEHLTKPITKEQLRRKLEKILDAGA